MKNNSAAKNRFAHEEGRIECRPFLKWAGGKSQILHELLNRVPQQFNRYYEPFLGGGALLFAMQPNEGYVSDINPDLINAYNVVKNDVESLIADLKSHIYDKDYYYKIRNSDRSLEYLKLSSVQRASRLIYLNKTCYNGLYRVNSKGNFNTPFGRYSNPLILDKDNLISCSKVLKNIEIHSASFEAIKSRVKKRDFIYFDPPYCPLNATSNFTSYSKEGFGYESQKTLRDLCYFLDKNGVMFMLSNSYCEPITELYKSFNIETVSALRSINSKGKKRGAVTEAIITNY